MTGPVVADAATGDNCIAVCAPIGELVCTSDVCRVVIDDDKVVQHLRRRHNIPSKVAKKMKDDVTGALESSKNGRVAFWRRYFDDPYPGKDGIPLPELLLLPITAILKCPLCEEYHRGTASLRVHLNTRHKRDPRVPSAKACMASPVVLNGQSLYSGPSTRYFPVLPEPNDGSNAEQMRILPKPRAKDAGRDAVSMFDRGMNAAAAILNLSSFMEKRRLSFEDAYKWTTFDSPQLFAIVAKLLQDYMKFFSDRLEEVPQFLIDLVRIKGIDADSNFSLHIQAKSKDRYSRSVSRFVICATNADKAGISTEYASYGHKIKQAADRLVRCVSCSEPRAQSLVGLHEFLRLLLLEEAKGSKGERVVLEDLYKLILVGFSSTKDRRIRFGYAEDASHVCAALQYVCQVTALGEFLLPPLGFGPKELDGASTEEERRKRIQAKLCAESATPAAFIRSTLRKTKRLSHGEAPKIEFAECYAHPFCGFVDNIEIAMDSQNAGSLGYAIRSIQSETKKLLEEDILRHFRIPE